MTGLRSTKRAESVFLEAVTVRSRWIHLFSAGALVGATLIAFAAQNSDRPRSAAAVYILGVTLVGALEGLWGGLLAALLASLIYNFFLSAPLFQFSLTSLEELVPPLAFIICAGASGLLTGWLKDRALAAEQATQRIGLLFELSRDLQAAVTPEGILIALRTFFGNPAGVGLYIVQGNRLSPVAGGLSRSTLAQDLLDRGVEFFADAVSEAYLLKTQERTLGVVVLPRPNIARRDRRGDEDFAAFLSVLTIALERCLLLDRVAAAELVAKSEAYKTALLSSVSHDMRTPLSAIAAASSSLSQLGNSLPETARGDLLAIIQEQCERLNRYTTNLLNLGRVQSGIDPSQFVECDAIEVLGSAISHVRALGTGHEIIKRYEQSNAQVLADPVMLEQVFYNVLENAARYSPSSLPLRVASFAREGTLVITVDDEGPGIDESDLERVFDRFFRGAAASGTPGSGLGLSISQGFVESFGGTIRAERPGGSRGGTSIVIEVPLSRMDAVVE